MQIENVFTVPLPPDRALDTLTDVPRIAPCLPGVELTQVNDDGSFEGTAKVRLGPVSLSFSGKARIEEIDRDARTARVVAEGADQKGRGRANAVVTFALTPHEGGTQVDVTSDINLSGSVAQYGRASGLIKEVANQIIAQFTANLEADLSSQGAGPEEGGEERDVSKPASGTGERPREIGGVSLLWRALVAWVRGLFGRG
jgi:carbon monoxide dehydrogenase subunit G